MSKLKHILSAFVACCMAVVLIFAVGCGGSPEPEPEPETGLISITLDTSDVKTEYYTGENFDETGLKLTANFADGTSKELTATSAGVNIDRTGYSSKGYGVREISVSYTEDGKTKSASFSVNVTDVQLVINGSEAKTTLIVNEDTFTTEGFKVSLSVTSPLGVNTTTLLDSGVTFTNNVKTATVGNYTLTAGYTYDGKKLTATYPVSVVEARYGYEVTIKDDLDGVLTMGENNESAYIRLGSEKQYVDLTSIDTASFISVKAADKYGVVAENAPEVDFDGLTVEVYKNGSQNPVENLANCTGGVYQIWVNGTVSGKECDAFAIVYVIDSLVKLELSTDESVITTQERSFENEIVETWKFVATYASGAQVTLDYDAEGIYIPEFSVNIKTDTNTVDVTFTEDNAMGETETVTCKAVYTLTGEVQIAPVVYFSADFLKEVPNYTNFTYENGGLEFVVSGAFTYDASEKSVTMPEGVLADNGASAITIANRLKGASNKTATISFTASKDFTLYIWALSASSSAARKVNVTGGTPAHVSGYKSFDEIVDGSSNPSARAGQFTNVANNTTFTLDFGEGVNLYYIAIVFGE